MIEKYQGFVTIPRDVQTLPIWGNNTDTALWLYCVLHASHQPYRDLKPGQFYASQVKIAEVMGMSRKTVGDSLRRLQSKGLLHAKTSELGTIITVCYWDQISSGRGFGQGDTLMKDTATGEVTAVPQRSRGKPAEEKPSTGDPIREEQFERFWLAYPKKSRKEEAKKLFMALTVNPQLVISSIEQARYTQPWLIDNGRYIPNPVNYLDGGWEQYVPASALRPKTEEELWMEEEEEWVTR